MPANLTPEYRRAEEQFRAAKTPEGKLEALEEMLRVVPKHKGTDGLQADLKARIAKLRKQPAAKVGKSSFTHMVPREGAGQVVLVGPPNSGKSALVAALTRATPDVGEYPFTTRDATPGMMRFENVAIQLVDLPPLSAQHVEPWVFDLVRTADLCWLVVDGRWAIEGVEGTLGLLGARGIGLRAEGEALPVRDLERVARRALLVVTGVGPAGGRRVDRHGGRTAGAPLASDRGVGRHARGPRSPAAAHVRRARHHPRAHEAAG